MTNSIALPRIVPRAFMPGPHRAALACAFGLALITALPNIPGWLNSDWQVAPQAMLRDAIPMQELLSARDKSTYAEIIRAQRTKDWVTVDALFGKLDSTLLEPTLLAQRWLEDRSTTPTAETLKTWLAANTQHPYTAHVHALARQRFPDQFATETTAERSAALALQMRPGSLASEPTVRYNADGRALSYLNAKERGQVQQAVEQFQLRMSEGKKSQGMSGIDKAMHGLSSLGQDSLRWQQANVLYSYGDMGSALRMAGPAADRSGATQPAMHWVAGMAAWEQDLPMKARHHFHLMAQGAKKLPAGDAAAAHFWAARAWDMTGRSNEATIMRKHAASYSETFYAHLARQQLKQPVLNASAHLREHTRLMARGYLDNNWAMTHPGALRAIAWQQLGQKSLAQWEMAQAFKSADSDEDRAVLAHLAGVMNMPGLQLAMARQLPKPYSRLSSYPIPSWKPRSGFEVEQPLLLGIARQESGFDISATSPAGASGLMQMMPQTAHYVARMPQMESDASAEQLAELKPASGGALSDPETSLTLGQRYLQYLSEKPYVDHNLILLIAAYNAGPKAAIQWSSRIEDGSGDPIAFIERLSYSETRAYVQHVLANSWTYHDLLGTQANSLKLLAKSDWPQLKGSGSWFARNGEQKPAQVAKKVPAKNVPVASLHPSLSSKQTID